VVSTLDASERLEMFFTEVRDLLRRALETGMDLGLVRRCPSELVAAVLLGMIRGVIELMVRRTDAARLLRVAGAVNDGMMDGTMDGTKGGMPDAASATVHSMVNDAVSELLQVALRGVLA
jgi:hypothetical protein